MTLHISEPSGSSSTKLSLSKPPGTFDVNTKHRAARRWLLVDEGAGLQYPSIACAPWTGGLNSADWDLPARRSLVPQAHPPIDGTLRTPLVPSSYRCCRARVARSLRRASVRSRRSLRNVLTLSRSAGCLLRYVTAGLYRRPRMPSRRSGTPNNGRPPTPEGTAQTPCSPFPFLAYPPRATWLQEPARPRSFPWRDRRESGGFRVPLH
jgi:hypothetical protein